MLKKIFTWWDGATIGTMLFSRRNGTRVGSDALGNIYFEGGDHRTLVHVSGKDFRNLTMDARHARFSHAAY